MPEDRVRQIVEWKMVELGNYYRYFNRLQPKKVTSQ